MPLKKEPSIGVQIDTLITMREEMRKLNRQAEKIKEVFDADSETLRLAMIDQGMAKATGLLGTVSLKEMVIAHVKDWDRVYNYILRNKAFHMLQKRISEPAFREAVELRKGKKIPGIEPFTKKGINLRAT